MQGEIYATVFSAFMAYSDNNTSLTSGINYASFRHFHNKEICIYSRLTYKMVYNQVLNSGFKCSFKSNELFHLSICKDMSSINLYSRAPIH